MPQIQKDHDPTHNREHVEVAQIAQKHQLLGESSALLMSLDDLPPYDSGEPLSLTSAGAKPYEGQAQAGRILKGETAPIQALEYVQQLIPNAHLTYVGSGRHGVVVKDDEGRAYKVYRSSLEYSRVEKEAGALQIMSQAGLAPRLHALVDAGLEYRLDSKANDYTQFGFEDVMIPRIGTANDLPVIIMDYIETEPLETATPEAFIDGFCATLELFVKEDIKCWDTEFRVDALTGRVVAIDVGELYQRSIAWMRSAQHSEESKIISNACLDFGLTRYQGQIAKAYSSGGIESVRTFLVTMPRVA